MALWGSGREWKDGELGFLGFSSFFGDLVKKRILRGQKSRVRQAYYRGFLILTVLAVWDKGVGEVVGRREGEEEEALVSSNLNEFFLVALPHPTRYSCRSWKPHRADHPCI